MGWRVYPPQPIETNVAAFVPEVLKAVWPMHWKRWYDCVSCAFAAFPRTKKQDKRLASEPTLRPITSARSAGS